MAATVTTPTSRRFIVAGALVGGLALALAHSLPSAMRARKNASYAPVTDQRLRKGDW